MTAAAQPLSETKPVQPLLARLTGWRAHALALAAGAMATLAHAPFHILPALIVAMTILVWLVDSAPQKTWRKAVFARTWWFAAGHFVSGLHWVSQAFAVNPDFNLTLGVLATLALGGGLALFPAVALTLAKPFWTDDYRRIPVFVLAYALADLLRGHLFGGFPWLLSAYVWVPGGAVSQAASVVGAYGLSVLTLLLAASPAAIFDHGRAVRRFGLVMVSALGFGLLWGFGFQRLSTASIAVPGATPVVRVAEPGLGQREKWASNPDEVLLAYLGVSGDSETSGADFVIWPEGAIPASAYTLVNRVEPGSRTYVLEPVRTGFISEVMGDRVLITGATSCAPDQACRAYFRGERGLEGLVFANSALVIDAVTGAPRPAGLYDKHRLTPFGEFIPLWSLISTLNIAPLQRIGAGFSPGPPPQRLVVDAAAEPLVIHICYESIFPGFTPRGEARPGWIVNISNDAWFGGGVGPAQHFAIARYRAIEEGLPLARAASGGVSAIVDAYGRAVEVADPAVGYAEAQLPATLSETLYARFDWWIIGALMAGLVAMRLAAPRFAPRDPRP